MSQYNDSRMTQPIAIVGFSFRLPGGADNDSRLWEILQHGEQAWSEVPESRYNANAFHHPDCESRGTHNARGGFFLQQDIATFDAKFFNIPEAEAAAIDPQQRMLLEVSYEALEKAGLPIEELRGSKTGVFVALVSRDYDRQIYKDPSDIPKHHLTGCGDATACGRISYTFDFRGPAMTIDTGCSGGMVGLNSACQSLQRGESDMALVGGANLLLGPDMTIAMSNLHMVNEDGRCYAFDDRGAGYGRAEGVAVLVLKRLSDAQKDGDNIRAVVLDSGVNQDGRTNGILMPNSSAQQQLAQSLCERSGIDPQSIAHVEMHGTGTVAGDSAEIKSIRDVFVGDASRRRQPLTVGSIKANLGHSESTSGLAGIISAVLAIEREYIPPVAALKTMKPEISAATEDGQIHILREPQPWPLGVPRRVCVNSFGFGGTNSHVILEAYSNDTASVGRTLAYCSNGTNGVGEDDGQNQRQLNSNTKRTVARHEVADIKATGVSDHDSCPRSQLLPLLVSAKSKESLKAALEKLTQWISRHGNDPLATAALSYTLSSRRSAHSWRAMSVTNSSQETIKALQAPRIERVLSEPKAVFLFTGQGAQYAAMGKELLKLDTAFKNSLMKSTSILRDTLGAQWSLLEDLALPDAESRINESRLSQPATTAIQIALVDLLDQLGVRPSAVLGHSSGEVAAAYAAGLLSHEDALTISYHKGFVAEWCRETMSKTKGAMLAVGLGEADTAKYLAKIVQGRASVACVNSPSSVTVSGDEVAVADLKILLDRDSIFTRRLKVDIAYHSYHMTVVSERFERSIDSIASQLPNTGCKFFSSVTGKEHHCALDRSYWVENLISKVRFSEALEALVHDCSSAGRDPSFVEIGPHGALEGPVKQTIAAVPNAPRWAYSSSLMRKRNSHEAAIEMAGRLWQSGLLVNFRTPLILGENRVEDLTAPTDLPAYAWDHAKKHWHESRLSTEYRFRKHPPHDLLGLRLPGTTTIEPIFRHILSVNELPWLREHIIDGFALYPGSAFLVHAIEGLKQIVNDFEEQRRISQYLFKNVSFTKSIVVPDSGAAVEVLLSLKPTTGVNGRLGIVWHQFRLISRQPGQTSWTDNCHGMIGHRFNENRSEQITCSSDQVESLKVTKACTQRIKTLKFYDELRQNGVEYGENFSIIDTLDLGDHTAVGTIRVPDIKKCMPSGYMQPHVIHPATFDAFMHVALPVYHRHCSEGPVMLTSISEATINADILNQPGSIFTVMCSLKQAHRKSGAVDVRILQQHNGRSDQLIEVATLTNEEFRSIGNGHVNETRSITAERDHAAQAAISCSVGWRSANANPPRGHGHYVKYQVQVISIDGQVSREDKASSMAAEVGQLLNAAVITWDRALAEGFNANCKALIIDESLTGVPSLEVIRFFEQYRDILWVKFAREAAEDEFDAVAEVSRIAQEYGSPLSILTVHDEIQPLRLQELIGEVLDRINSDAGELKPLDYEYTYLDGDLLVPRLRVHEPSGHWLRARNGLNEFVHHGPRVNHGPYHGTTHLKLEFGMAGMLSSARFAVHSYEQGDTLGPEQIEVKVYAHAVNRDDVSIATGRGLSSQSMTGEYAGVVLQAGREASDHFKPGDRVCGLRATPDYGNIVRVSLHNALHMDANHTFEDAAAMPLACLTAHHALVVIGRVDSKRRVLIHGASGGIGQAAVILAQQLGAQVFCTVSTDEKARVVTDVLNVPRKQVLSNCSTTFLQTLQEQTCGEGVDVVLNCSSADLTEPSFLCLSDGGVLVNLIKSDVSIPSRAMDKSISYVMLNMSSLLNRSSSAVQFALKESTKLYRASNKRIQTTSFPVSELEKAFRLLMGQKVTGKVVLSCAENSRVSKEAPKLRRSSLLDREAFYVLVGGSYEARSAVCTFLADRGAREIVDIDIQDDLIAGNADSGGNLSNNFHHEVVRVADQADFARLLEEKGDKPAPVIINLGPHFGLRAANPHRSHAQNGSDNGDTYSDVGTETFSRSVLERIVSHLAPELFINIFQYRDTDQQFSSFRSSSNPALDGQQLKRKKLSLYVPSIEHGENYDEVSSRLYQLLEYCLVTTDDLPRELVLLPRAPSPNQYSRNTIFEDLTREDAVATGESAEAANITIEKRLRMAKDSAEVKELIASEICQQLATFCATEMEDIKRDSSILDIGLDSLLAIEFKNWLGRVLLAPMQTTEILDASSLNKLISLVIARSPYGTRLNRENALANGNHVSRGSTNGHQEDTSEIQQPSKQGSTMQGLKRQQIPHLPLPELDSLIERHLIGVRPFASVEEFEQTMQVSNDYRAVDGIGTSLYKSLVSLKESDPEGWYPKLYGNSMYYGRKGALAPYALFYFTHPLIYDTPRRHTQVERASLITSVLLAYKQRLQEGLVQPQYLNEQPQCMELYNNLFNACREPRVGLDVFNVHPGHEYFLVMRRGHIFKVKIADVLQHTSEGQPRNARLALEQLFAEILHATDFYSTDWLGILSGQHRTSWARDYEEFMHHSPENAAYLRNIQASAFIICLDDGTPETSEQRARQLHFGDGSNRWFDKSLQYVIFANGISGSLADHTGLDAPTVQAVNMEIVAAIREDHVTTNGDSRSMSHSHDMRAIPFQELSHVRFPNFDESIARVRSSYDAMIARRRHFFTTLPFGASLMRAHKIPPASGIQLVVQLAARYFFGYSPGCWETVLQTSFHHGRVEINQVVSVEVLEWIRAVLAADSGDEAGSVQGQPAYGAPNHKSTNNAASSSFASSNDTSNDDNPYSNLKRKYLAAARRHAGNILAVTRSGGSDRYLSLLQEMSKLTGTANPALYLDPPYQRSRPRKLMSSNFTTHMAENGCVQADEDSVWSHFEFDQESVKFCGLGEEGQTERWVAELHRAAVKVQDILMRG